MHVHAFSGYNVTGGGGTPPTTDFFVYSKKITDGVTFDVYEQIWKVAWAGGTAFAVTTSTANGDLDTDPHVRPDDFSQITFLRAVGAGTKTLYVMDQDGTNVLQLDASASAAPMFSPDGSKILYRQGSNIKTINPDGTGVATVLTKSNVRRPTWNFDGTKISYQVNNSNPTQDTLWVVNPDGTGDTQIGSVGTGNLIGSGVGWYQAANTMVYCKIQTGGGVFKINSDGTGNTAITTTSDLTFTTRASMSDDDSTAFAVLLAGGLWTLYQVPVNGSGESAVSPTVTLFQLEGSGQPYVYGSRVWVCEDSVGALYSIMFDGSDGRVDDTPRTGPAFYDEIHIQGSTSGL